MAMTGPVRRLTYAAYGEPLSVVRLETAAREALSAGMLRLRFLAAPINPSDVNQIQGVYPVKPPLPAVGGNEGVAEVSEVSDDLKGKFNVGDRVIPASSGFGTWRTEALAHGDAVLPVAKDIPIEAAATISVNPCTALRMLHDFVQLQPGDAVVQNAANSAVGMAVIGLARGMGIKTINVVRMRPDNPTVADDLRALGADMVINEAELSALVRDRSRLTQAGIERVPLALNAVGGPLATDIARLLDHGGMMVTYGGMSKKPVTVPTSTLIFKDIRLCGFWMTHWNATRPLADRLQMLADVTAAVRRGELALPVEKHSFETDYRAALEAATGPYRQRKQLLVMQ